MAPTGRARGWAAIVLVIYVAIAAVLLLVPRPIDEGFTPWIRGVIASMQRVGLPSVIDYDFVEYVVHFAVFVPFGILLAVALGRRLVWLALLLGIFGRRDCAELGTSGLAEEPPSQLDLVAQRRRRRRRRRGRLVGSGPALARPTRPGPVATSCPCCWPIRPRRYAEAMAAPSPTRTRSWSARVAARVILAPYLVALSLIVFLPAREAGRVTGVVGWLTDLVATWGIEREPAAVVVEFLANMVLFVPFGLLLSAAGPRWTPWSIIGTGALVSVVIELVQLGIPSRVASVSDVIANTAGTAVGCLVVPWWRVSRERRPTSPTSR